MINNYSIINNCMSGNIFFCFFVVIDVINLVIYYNVLVVTYVFILCVGGGKINICFRGVRGSYPVLSSSHRRYGGEGSCCEVEVAGRRIIFDAGSGIIRLGKELVNDKLSSSATICFSHFHNDHYMGLNYFIPLYMKNYHITFLGPVYGKGSLRDNLEYITDVLVHPVKIIDTPCCKDYLDITGGETYVYREGRNRPYLRKSGNTKADEVVIRTLYNKKHSQLGVINYRIEYQGKVFVFATDVEANLQLGYDKELAEFAAGADLLAMDGQYTLEDYKTRMGWGHSTYIMSCKTAEIAGVKKLAIIHHDPDHDDKIMSEIAKKSKVLFKNTVVAREMMKIEL